MDEINLYKILQSYMYVSCMVDSDIKMIIEAMDFACTKTIELAIYNVSDCYPDQEKESILRVYNKIKMK